MSKRRNFNGKELDQLQKVKAENQRLKKEIASLRKQLARTSIDNYNDLKELDQETKSNKKVDPWQCWQCTDGSLKITILDRIDGSYYYRRCSSCEKRTKLKRFNENVRE